MELSVIIDAHHHLWKYNDREYPWMNEAMGALRRDFLIPELESVMRESGVGGTVAVQARQTIEETKWLLKMAAQHSFLLGVVGWVPLCEPHVASTIERLAQQPSLKGVRHVLHDEEDDFYILRDDFNSGVRVLRDYGLAYDILIFERHLPQAIEFVDRHPDQIFIIDHIAKPKIRDGMISPWRERIQEIAKRENVYCKVSGMATEADWKAWTPEMLRSYFDVVLSAFGPKRLMFGSDWPVVELAAPYKIWVETFRMMIADLSPDEQESISHGTAVAAYRLDDRGL
jgi:L-fuconolactonase